MEHNVNWAELSPARSTSSTGIVTAWPAQREGLAGNADQAVWRLGGAPDTGGQPEGGPDLVSHHQQPGAVQGPAVPPSRPAPGRGRPRTQVERGSLGSGRPPTPSGPAAPVDPGHAADLRQPELTDAHWAALQQLADAHDAVVARWPVGRAIALTLVRHGLVHACSEWVWLTEAGRRALDTVRAHQPVHAQHPQPDATPADQAARPTPLTPTPSRRAEPTRPGRRPAGSELPPGVLLRAARAHHPNRP